MMNLSSRFTQYEERRVTRTYRERKYLPFLLVPINWSSMALIWSVADIFGSEFDCFICSEDFLSLSKTFLSCQAGFSQQETYPEWRVGTANRMTRSSNSLLLLVGLPGLVWTEKKSINLRQRQPLLTDDREHLVILVGSRPNPT